MERVSRTATKQERDRSHERSRSRGRDRDRSRDRPPNSRLADKRVYISNIPYETRWQDVKDLFRNEVGEVAYVELFVDENDKPRGCGIIELETSVLAKKAIEKMHRYEMSGRKIVVKEDYDVERDKTGRIVNPGGGGGGRRDRERSRERDRDRDWDGRRRDLSPNSSATRGNTYGLSSEFLESLGIDGPLLSKVFVSNLDFRVDEKKLREVFRLAGRVMCVEVNKDKDGKSRGHGTIEYEHPVEAVQSISMFNNQELYDRRMHVRMDRLPDPLTDLAKNRLPEGLKGIGMGLGMNGQPLVDVSRNLPSSNTNGNVASLFGSGLTGQAQAAINNAVAAATAAASAANPLSGMNLGGMNVGLASMLGQQGLDSLTSASNAFGSGLSLGALANSANQLSASGLSGLSSLGAGGMGLTGQANAASNLMQTPNASMGAGGLAGMNMNQAFQNSNPNASQAAPGQGQGQVYRDSSEYGYSTSVYSTPSSNYNTAYQREKQFGNGVGSATGGGATGNNSSNTVIISNLPTSCTWQVLKSKFRECGEVVYAEIRDNKGIVRFASERDAERAVKVFDQSRVDGKTVMVRFL